MLTNVYYFRHYSPYLVPTQTPDGVKRKREKIAKKPKANTESSKFMLNKALKSDIVSHARNTSNSVNSVKEGAKHVLNNIDAFNYEAHEKGFDLTRDALSEKISNFTENYNSSIEFMENQEHSQILRDFASNLKELFNDSREDLSRLDISEADGNLSFSEEKFRTRSHEDLNLSFAYNIPIFKAAYDDSSSILRRPLSDHMEFDEFKYFYNYRLGNVASETFKVIDAGLIIDTFL